MENICAIPDCNKPIKNWRTHFCSNSHCAKYSSLVKNHGFPLLPPKYKNVVLKRGKGRSVPKSYKDRTPEQKAKWCAYVVARRRLRDKSMPLWADKNAIESFYIEAKRLTEETGIKHEVDHIIPSNHPLVCGLHVENNLQILTEFENISKNNKFIVE